MATEKPVHTVVLDTGAIIKNEPPVSTLLKQAETLVTVPAIINEIRDAATRSRVETLLKPFLTIRSPSPASLKFVTDFARKTGDLAVLSKPDIQIIALTYELECERNHGDWRLRRTPGQKEMNGRPPAEAEKKTEGETEGQETQTSETPASDALVDQSQETAEDEMRATISETQSQEADAASSTEVANTTSANQEHSENVSQLGSQLEAAGLEDQATDSPEQAKIDSVQNSADSQEDSESDSDADGWITPSNLKKKQAKDTGVSAARTSTPKTMQVAVLTSDFAMQNVILQIGLNLLSSSMASIRQLKTFVMRCHACFNVSKDVSKQFCPRCGQPTLTKVACSTNANGEFKLHLKKNFQYNNRGNRYSVPKPVHGSTNGKIVGGGKGGWGNDLILAEDQKEYEKAARDEKRQKERSLMDEDYLPSILTGDRSRTGGRIRVGAGKNVNSRKR